MLSGPGGTRGASGATTCASAAFHFSKTPDGEFLDDVGRERLGVVLVGDEGLVDEQLLDLAPHAQEGHEVDDLLDLRQGHQGLERGHRGAGQAVEDGLAQVGAGRLGADGRGGELEQPEAEVAGAGEEEVGRRPAAVARDPVAVQAVAPVERIPPLLRTGARPPLGT
jgi:hypothetical protein